MKNNITFGLIDTNTGEFQEGLIDKEGNMVYKNPLPWWKRMFGKKGIDDESVWLEPEYRGIADFKRMIITGAIEKFSAPVYIQKNRFTDRQRAYVLVKKKKYFINIDALLNGNHIILE